MGQEIENPLFARFFHRFCGRDRGKGEQDLRREMLAGATGRVVEVGLGNGINFPHYPPTVAEVIAVEPEPYLRSQAEKAAAGAPVPVRVVTGVADALELEAGSVDAVIACGVLCSVPDQPPRSPSSAACCARAASCASTSTSAPAGRASPAGSAASTRCGPACSAAATRTATRWRRSSAPASSSSAAAASRSPRTRACTR